MVYFLKRVQRRFKTENNQTSISRFWKWKKKQGKRKYG